MRAYEDLLAEGYLEARPGSGSYVSPFLGKMPPADRDGRGGRRGLGRPVAARAAPSDAGGQNSSAGGAAKRLPFDFRPGIPDWDAFPRALWLRLIGRALRKKAAELGRYGEPGGYFPLRQAIARHLAVSRGALASARQVVIVSGSQQALDLIARLCVRPGDGIALEDPGYPEAHRVLSASAGRRFYAPVDEEGINVDVTRAHDPLPACAALAVRHPLASIPDRGDPLPPPTPGAPGLGCAAQRAHHRRRL